MAGGVAHFMASVGMDNQKAAREQEEREREEMIERFEASLIGEGRLFAGRRSNLDDIDREVWTNRSYHRV
ncbi:MAG: hypothetical protein GY788_23160 [bacterium]|nr:hypothetical protein [bacterium]